MTTINVGDIWERKEKLGDEYDRVRVVGKVDHAGRLADEWSIQPADSFGSTIQSDAEGFEACTLVSSGDADGEAWETDVGR